MLPLLPNDAIHRVSEASSNNPRGPVLRKPALPIAGDVPAALHERVRNDSVWCGALPGRWRAEASYREQFELFPYVDSTPQYTPHMFAKPTAQVTDTTSTGARVERHQPLPCSQQLS